MYQIQQPSSHYGGQGADTTNLGYTFPNGYNPPGQSAQPPIPGLPQTGSSSNGMPQMPGAGTSNPNDPYSIQNLIKMQMDQNNQSRAQNQSNWTGASDYMKSIPAAYNAQASTQSAQSLTGQLAANPLSLSPDVVQNMKNEASNQISAQTDNTARQVQGTLAAGGQADASTLAAMNMQLARQGMGAQQTQNTNIDIDAAKQRTTDLQNAAGLSQRQSAQDINIPMQTGNSILSHLPQVRPDDYSGLLSLTNQMQNQQFQNQMLQYNAQMGRANAANANPLRAPVAASPIGGKYSGGGQAYNNLGQGAGNNNFSNISNLNNMDTGNPSNNNTPGAGMNQVPRGTMQAFGKGNNQDDNE